MKLIFGVIFTFVAVLFVVEIVNSVSYYSKDDYIVIKVEDKDRSTSEDGSVYRVYTEHETFEIADSLFPPVFNSADRYRKLKRNQFYRCRAIGFRSD
ncbi:hypothetical protein H6775_03875, partial [Candidatus Nomurabacteria bacterium]|nr:hypothetical protein [Candidatus Nomurabacteria bacterium]